MAVCDKWVALKIVEFFVCVACLVAKRISADDEVRLALLLQKLSREWSLLTSVTWDSVGGAFADAVYGGYTIITFGLMLGRVFQELRGRRILESFMLGMGLLFFLVLGGLELASLDSVPHRLIVNASVLGSFSLLAAALFLLDLMGPRTYYSSSHAQTDAGTTTVVTQDFKKVTTNTSSAQTNGNGHIPNGKQNGVQNGITKIDKPNGKPLETDIDKVQTRETKLDDNVFFPKYDENVLGPDGLHKSKFGSVRNDIEGGNYVRLSDPLAEPDRLHYERELAKFNEKYFRDYLEVIDGRFNVKEDYLPEPQTPTFAKVQSGRLRTLSDEVSPTYEKKRASKSPTRASKSPTRVRTVATPTLQQLEDYLRSSSRSRRSETPALFPMEPIDEVRASGTPTDPGYVQYAADKWPNKREIHTPRHSPTQ